jgi:hypothetical protein
MERPFDAVWRKILAQTVPYIDPQENTLSIPQGKARASVPPRVIPRTAEVVDACLAIFQERRSSLDGYMQQRDKELATYFYDVAHVGGFGARSN